MGIIVCANLMRASLGAAASLRVLVGPVFKPNHSLIDPTAIGIKRLNQEHDWNSQVTELSTARQLRSERMRPAPPAEDVLVMEQPAGASQALTQKTPGDWPRVLWSSRTRERWALRPAPCSGVPDSILHSRAGWGYSTQQTLTSVRCDHFSASAQGQHCPLLPSSVAWLALAWLPAAPRRTP